jgi:toxin HigB-1
MSIRSFAHKGLDKLFMMNDPSELSAKDVQRIRRVLSALNSAKSKRDLNYPGSGFHQLNPVTGNKYALKVDKRFRVTFVWDEDHGNASRVNLEDYH